jgi:glycosyltransferase involved in cell wall biosynthesis
MRQIAERMVQRGHEVTVATSRLKERDFDSYNGVRIAEFDVAGNLARGMKGEVDRYRDFIAGFNGDAILIKAAQQWTFDAVWSVLDQVKARKVFIPCGFSGLFEPAYEKYFQDIPEILCKFDHLIFYAEHYRDIDFARAHGMEHFSVLPNGASEVEFAVAPDHDFRRRHGIPESSFLLLTVGSLTGAKGHAELAEAMVLLDTGGRHVTAILNGNSPPVPPSIVGGANDPERRLWWFEGRMHAVIDQISQRIRRVFGLAYRSISVLRREGWTGVGSQIMALRGDTLRYWIAKANKQAATKKVLQLDLPRAELIQAYLSADLFVFASNIEYSPLVLYESAAAGTPFLTVPVGNAEEIALWTGGGLICPASKDERGYTRVAPKDLAAQILDLINQPDLLRDLGCAAHNSWQDRFTWKKIAGKYEQILSGSEAS